MMMMDITVLAILMVGMGIIPLRANYYPAESQIESPPDIQHAGDSNATNRRTNTNTSTNTNINTNTNPSTDTNTITNKNSNRLNYPKTSNMHATQII